MRLKYSRTGQMSRPQLHHCCVEEVAMTVVVKLPYYHLSKQVSFGREPGMGWDGYTVHSTCPTVVNWCQVPLMTPRLGSPRA